MGKRTPSVSLVILSYNGESMTRRLLETLRITDYPSFRTIVVDNGSREDRSAALRKDFPSVDVLRLERNAGFSGGCNIGMAHALERHDPDYILLLNNDMEAIEPCWLSEMVRTAESSGDIGVTGCRLVNPDGSPQDSYGTFLLFNFLLRKLRGFARMLRRDPVSKPAETFDTDFVVGACFLIRKSLIREIGLLDECYNPAYFEELDYCARALKAGYRVVHTTRAAIMHYGGRTIRDGGDCYGLLCRNGLRFIRMNFPWYWLAAYLPRMLVLSVVVPGDGGAPMISPAAPGRLRIALRCMADSLRGGERARKTGLPPAKARRAASS